MPFLLQSLDYIKSAAIDHPWSLRLATLSIALYLIYAKITTPPAQLRHLPQAPFFAVLKGLIKKPIDEFSKETTLPTASLYDHGLYVVSRSLLMPHVSLLTSAYILNQAVR